MFVLLHAKEHVFSVISNLHLAYSWIGGQLDVGRMPAFWLFMSNLKSVTSFGFLVKNYMGHDFRNFVEPQNGLVWHNFVFCFFVCFPRGF